MVNKVILIGRLGKDPEIMNFEGGTVKANFSLATDEVYRDRNTNEKVRITDWHNIVMWRKQAEIAQKYLKKGDLVYIEGKIKTRSYDKNGETKYITEIVVDSFTMLGSKSDNSGNSNNDNSGAYQQQSNQSSQAQTGGNAAPASDIPDNPEEGEDDLPF